MYDGYSSKVIQYFRNRKNVGEIEAPDGVGTASGLGVFMQITITVEDRRIVDAKFQSTTCAVAVAVCSLVTELAKQMTWEQIFNLSPSSLADQLGGIPEEKTDRCHLAIKALHNAILDYLTKQGRTHPAS